ncbi:MAG TPA: hypothetical protein ENL21_02330 [Caldithrix abyssi]|uniref:Uncharacterized protein n=1 Tax=Caldithrix abyssi TaxID=187145 RepID=A0A7V5H301_CALAY|nr:hypothetical protein [Caldithrix abyssi]
MANEKPFKKCSLCGKVWKERGKFLSDPAVLLIGYQAHFKYPDKGLILFEHHTADCGTSMAIRVGEFEDLYDGEHYDELLFGTDDCPGYCLDEYNFKKCENRCRVAFAREIVNLIHNKKAVA